jgi:RNA exonuclease 4
MYLAQSFEEVQKQVRDILKDRVLVGHAIQGDLNVLKLTHPKDKIRDTGLYEPFRTKYAAGKIPSLKKVVQGELNISVQKSEHNAVCTRLNISKN